MEPEPSNVKSGERPAAAPATAAPSRPAQAPPAGIPAPTFGLPSTGAAERPVRPRRRRRWVLRALLALLALAGAFGLYQLLTWPEVAALASENPATTAFIERARREGPAHAVAWQSVPYGRMSTELKHAVVAAEDLDFFSHHGFDWDELEKATEAARHEGKPLRGASTITQQLAKNLWLSPSRNPWRKVKEALLTRQLERHLGKRRILELYLNVAEFGPRVFGAEAAARRYFGKPAADLTAHEAAQLAAGLSRPSLWHPGVTTRGYLRQVAIVEGRVAKTAWVRRDL